MDHMTTRRSPLTPGFLRTSPEIFDEIANRPNITPEELKKFWQTYASTWRRLIDPNALRLEHFWWHVWGSDLRHLSGATLARLFKQIATEAPFVPLMVSQPSRGQGKTSTVLHDASKITDDARPSPAPAQPTLIRSKTYHPPDYVPSAAKPAPAHPILKKKPPVAPGPGPRLTARFATPPVVEKQLKPGTRVTFQPVRLMTRPMSQPEMVAEQDKDDDAEDETRGHDGQVDSHTPAGQLNDTAQARPEPVKRAEPHEASHAEGDRECDHEAQVPAERPQTLGRAERHIMPKNTAAGGDGAPASRAPKISDEAKKTKTSRPSLAELNPNEWDDVSESDKPTPQPKLPVQLGRGDKKAPAMLTKKHIVNSGARRRPPMARRTTADGVPGVTKQAAQRLMSSHADLTKLAARLGMNQNPSTYNHDYQSNLHQNHHERRSMSPIKFERRPVGKKSATTRGADGSKGDGDDGSVTLNGASELAKQLSEEERRSSASSTCHPIISPPQRTPQPQLPPQPWVFRRDAGSAGNMGSGIGMVRHQIAKLPNGQCEEANEHAVADDASDDLSDQGLEMPVKAAKAKAQPSQSSRKPPPFPQPGSTSVAPVPPVVAGQGQAQPTVSYAVPLMSPTRLRRDGGEDGHGHGHRHGHERQVGAGVARQPLIERMVMPIVATTSSVTAVGQFDFDGQGLAPALHEARPRAHGGSGGHARELVRSPSLLDSRLAPTQPKPTPDIPLGRTRSQLNVLLDRESRPPRRLGIEGLLKRTISDK